MIPSKNVSDYVKHKEHPKSAKAKKVEQAKRGNLRGNKQNSAKHLPVRYTR